MVPRAEGELHVTKSRWAVIGLTRRGKAWTLLASRFGPGLALLLVFGFLALADEAQPHGSTFLSSRNLQPCQSPRFLW
jgi:hypothetical protein